LQILFNKSEYNGVPLDAQGTAGPAQWPVSQVPGGSLGRTIYAGGHAQSELVHIGSDVTVKTKCLKVTTPTQVQP